MQTTKEVKTSLRKQRRDIRDRLGKDFYKFLVEIILNSDDSYKRIEARNIERSEMKEIVIRVDSSKREIIITDFAEGLSSTDFLRVFGVYGEDHNDRLHTHNVRGLFGQGAADVMFACALDKKKALFESIKDGIYATCKFHIEHDLQVVKVDEPPLRSNQLDELRKKLGIQENGTVVTFVLPDNVPLGKGDRLRQGIEKHVYFRNLLIHPKRRVLLDFDGRMDELSSLHYQLRSIRKLIKESFVMPYKGEYFKLDLSIHLIDANEKNNTHILVMDEEHNIYDNTFFNHQKKPATNSMAGSLVIHGFSHYLHQVLNSDKPETIITDTRDGFKLSSEFYHQLEERMDAYITKAIALVDKLHRSQEFVLKNNKYLARALLLANKELEDLSEDAIPGSEKELVPPKEGLAFARPEIKISIKKIYTIKLLINTKLIPPGSIIHLKADEDRRFSFFPTSIEIGKDDVNDLGVVTKSIRIKAYDQPSFIPDTITASFQSYRSYLGILIIDREMHYPPLGQGIDFYPNITNFVHDSVHVLNLYFDTKVCPLGSKVELIDDSQGALHFEQTTIILSKKDMIDDEIGVTRIRCTGGAVKDRFTVTASQVELQAKVTFMIVENSIVSQLSGGLFSQFKIRPDGDSYWQSTTEQSSIIINSSNPINRTMISSLTILNKDRPEFESREYDYIYELLASEVAKLRVEKELGGLHHVDALHLYGTEKSKIYEKLVKHVKEKE